MGFKIRCQVGGGGTQFSKVQYVSEFLNIWFQKSRDIIDKTKSVNDLSKILIFFVEKTFFFVFLWGVLIVARYLTLFLFFLWGFKICFFRRILKIFFF